MENKMSLYTMTQLQNYFFFVGKIWDVLFFGFFYIFFDFFSHKKVLALLQCYMPLNVGWFIIVWLVFITAKKTKKNYLYEIQNTTPKKR
jgi:hypothetical protein